MNSRIALQNDLQILIAELQQEVALLQQALNDCLEDNDYKGAKWHQKVLGYTKEKLGILKSLENPNFNKIADLKAMIHRMKNADLEKLPPELEHAYRIVNEKQIHAFEQQLHSLEQKERKYQIDSDELASCIEDLMAHKIESISLELPRTVVTLHIGSAGDAILLELKGLDGDPNDKRIRQRGTGELKRMGFEIQDNSATKRVEHAAGEDIPMILQLLSRIMFDVLGLYGDKMAILRVGKNVIP